MTSVRVPDLRPGDRVDRIHGQRVVVDVFPLTMESYAILYVGGVWERAGRLGSLEVQR